MTHSDAEYLKAAFRQERQGVTQMSHISTVLRAHQTAGLFLPWLPTLPTKFISMTVCVDWTVFLTLTSPFNPQPLWNPVLSAVDLGVPSFIYLIKHLSFVQQPGMQKQQLCPGTATLQFPPLCSGLCAPSHSRAGAETPSPGPLTSARAAPSPGTAACSQSRLPCQLLHLPSLWIHAVPLQYRQFITSKKVLATLPLLGQASLIAIALTWL